MGSFCYRKSAILLFLWRKLQIRKFLRCQIPLIAKSANFSPLGGENTYFKKLAPFQIVMAKPPKCWL
jgi:hypothetical protein